MGSTQSGVDLPPQTSDTLSSRRSTRSPRAHSLKGRLRIARSAHEESTITLDIDDPDLLSHYTFASTALEKILFCGRLRLGRLRLTNDPREAQKWKFTLASKNRPPEQIFSLEQLFGISKDESDEIIKGGVKVLCLTRSLEGAPPGRGRPRMWSQYADHYKGVCLLFDKMKLHKSIAALGSELEIYHGPVRYSNLAFNYDIHHAFDLNLDELEEQGLKPYLLNHRRQFYRDFFMAKHSDWLEEAEYRWIGIAGDDEPRFVDINEALAAVIVGDEFPRVYELCLRDLCERLGARAGRMRWQNGYPMRPRWEICDLT